MVVGAGLRGLERGKEEEVWKCRWLGPTSRASDFQEDWGGKQ